MVSAIFQAEVTTLESQLAALQAQIAAVEAQRTAITKAESVAAGIVQAVAAGIEEFQQISGISTDAIARVRDAVLGIFQGDGNDNGGNNPLEPAPQPNDDGGSKVVVEAEQDSAAATAVDADPETVAIAVELEKDSSDATAVQETVDATTAVQETVAIAVELEQDSSAVDAIATQSEELTGQHCEWASPLASPLATPLCCQLEDCPQSVLKGQAVDLYAAAYSRHGFKYLDDAALAVETSTTLDTPKEPDYFELVPVGDAVAYFRNNKTGEIVCTYLGGNNKQKLKLWGEWLCNQHSVGSGFQLREAERLTAFKHELKIWGMSLSQIERLAESNTQKNPPSNFGTFTGSKVEPVAPAPKPLQIEDVEVGDIVRNTTVKNWTYVVLAKMENGMLDCQRNNTPVGTPEIRLAVHPASVELVSRANKTEDSATPQTTSIDIKDVPVGVRLEQTADAFIIKYRAWAWCVVRVFGKPEVQQKCIGTLTETAEGISANRPHGLLTTQSYNRTFDAIKYLMQGASLKLADTEAAYRQHQSYAVVAAIPAVTPEQAKADLFGDVPALADAFGGFSF